MTLNCCILSRVPVFLKGTEGKEHRRRRGVKGREKRENEIQSVENWVLNWPGVCLSPKRWSCCNENGIPDAYEGRLFPLLIPLSKKTSLFLKVIVAVIRERVLLRVTAKGLRGSGWLDNLVPIPASLPSSWASPPPACLPACSSERNLLAGITSRPQEN